MRPWVVESYKHDRRLHRTKLVTNDEVAQEFIMTLNRMRVRMVFQRGNENKRGLRTWVFTTEREVALPQFDYTHHRKLFWMEKYRVLVPESIRRHHGYIRVCVGVTDVALNLPWLKKIGLAVSSVSKNLGLVYGTIAAAFLPKLVRPPDVIAVYPPDFNGLVG
jgi:hypothetical protein